MSNQKYLVITLTDQSKFKIDREEVCHLLRQHLKEDMARDLAELGDISLDEAMKLAHVEDLKITDDQVIGYSQVMDWNKISSHAYRLDNGWPAVNIQEDLLHCQKVIMTEEEIDRYLTREVLSN